MHSSTDTIFMALADPTRRAILEQLTRGPARVTDIAAPFDVSLNAVSKHLKVLEQARLVRRTVQGREHTLELDPAPLREVGRWAADLERFWNQRLDQFTQHFQAKRATTTEKKPEAKEKKR